MDNDFQKILLSEIKIILKPAVDAAYNDLSRKILFANLGWDLDTLPGLQIDKLITLFKEFSDSYERITSIIETPPKTLPELVEALRTVDKIFKTIQQLREVVGGAVGVQPPPQFNNIAKDVIALLFTTYLQGKHPVIYRLGVVLGFIRALEEPPLGDAVVDANSGAIIRYPHLQPEFRFDQIAKILKDPIGYLKTEYLDDRNLDTAEDAKKAADKLFPRLGALLSELGFDVVYGIKPAHMLNFGDLGNKLGSNMLTASMSSTQGSRVGATLTLSSADRGNLGLVIVPFGEFKFSQVFNSWEIAIDLAIGTEGFAIGPNGLTFTTAAPEGSNVKGQLTVTKIPENESQANAPALLIGGTTGTRLEIGQFQIIVELNLDVNSQDYGLSLNLGSASLVIDPADGDGFLQQILPADGLRIDFALAIGWSKTKGFYFVGGAGFEATLPVLKSILGIVNIDSVYLALQTSTSKNNIEAILAASGSFVLGPVKLTIHRIGMEATLSFPPEGGNIGLVNLNFAFKPPDGAGLSIDAAAIVGGGYLYFDQKNEQYAGIIQLEVKGGIALKAIGLLTTRLPDGSKGFSLVIIISGEFPPIQLGFGFSLNGVGGLVGINRTMFVDVLRAGIKNRILDSILFPKDPVANAARIISDLQNVFPPIVGRYVFGPMAILAWGVPPMLTAELGILLELPAPVRLAILGKLKLVLPKEEISLILLQMDVIGIIDFDKGDVSVDATLYDSRIAQFVVSGDMAVRANFGASPTFALAAGGFNPRFQPPPNFPVLEQLAISIARGDNPRLRLEAYLALTSNTVQLGARLDLYAAVDLGGILGLFSVNGYLGFDTLFQFSPFHFIVDIYGGLSLKRNGKSLFAVDLAMSLEGPEPMHAWGKATFDFLGKHSVDLNITIGSEQPQPPLPESNPIAELVTALNDIRSWSAQLPSDGHMLVTLRKIETINDVLVHPLGNLTVHERIVPLGIEITKFGNTVPTGNRTFDISVIVFNNTSISVNDTIKNNFAIKDYFSPNQFFDLTDDEKIFRPSFEAFASGYTQIGSSAMMGSTEPISFGEGITCIFEYDTVIIDKKEDISHKLFDKYSMAPEVMLSLSELGSAAKSAMANSGSNQFAGPKQKISLKETEYVVTSVKDLTVPSGMKSGLTYTEADAKKKKDFTRSEDWQITASHEVN
jgi:hypothetical protein